MTHYYHMHTWRGDVYLGVWGYGCMHAIKQRFVSQMKGNSGDSTHAARLPHAEGPSRAL